MIKKEKLKLGMNLMIQLIQLMMMTDLIFIKKKILKKNAF